MAYVKRFSLGLDTAKKGTRVQTKRDHKRRLTKKKK